MFLYKEEIRDKSSLDLWKINVLMRSIFKNLSLNILKYFKNISSDNRWLFKLFESLIKISMMFLIWTSFWKFLSLYINLLNSIKNSKYSSEFIWFLRFPFNIIEYIEEIKSYKNWIYWLSEGSFVI